MMNNTIPYKEVGEEKFTVYYCDDDHFLMIKKASYNDIDLYYVIMEDAYRTPTAEIMTKEVIFNKFKIEVE